MNSKLIGFNDIKNNSSIIWDFKSGSEIIPPIAINTRTVINICRHENWMFFSNTSSTKIREYNASMSNIWNKIKKRIASPSDNGKRLFAWKILRIR